MRDRTNEMITRLNYEARYVAACEAKNHRVDWDRVITGHAQAFAAGIINGECENNCELELLPNKNNDKHFKIIIDALTAKQTGKSKKPDHLTLKFTGNHITDQSLEALAKAMKNSLFPHNVTIDLENASGFSDAGVRALLNAMMNPDCNLTVDIKFPNNPKNVTPELLDNLYTKQSENQSRYKPEAKESKKKDKQPKLFSTKKKAKASSEDTQKKSPRTSLFGKPKTKTIKTEEKKRVTYSRHPSESKIKR